MNCALLQIHSSKINNFAEFFNLNMRIYFPVFLIVAGLLWAVYNYFIKKDIKTANEILSFTIFFGLIWLSLFYFIFNI